MLLMMMIMKTTKIAAWADCGGGCQAVPRTLVTCQQRQQRSQQHGALLLLLLLMMMMTMMMMAEELWM
jgi:hypothetical protein